LSNLSSLTFAASSTSNGWCIGYYGALPNCHTEQFGHTVWFVAIRDIAACEELTYNYGYEVNDEPAEPCHCGAHHCCGYILGPQYWDRLKPPALRKRETIRAAYG
jgi:hypothetical protein